MNIKDVEFDFRMGCILVLFPFLWIINVQFTNFGFLKFWFSNIVILAYFDPNYYFYHWNFSKATFIYKMLDEITLTHTGWAWKIQNVIFCHFWELKNSSHAQTFKYTSKPTPPTVFNLQASDWVHCEEETGAYTQLSQNTYKFVSVF